MSYLVFARKFRPQIFDDVVGQEHVTTTLRNAIKKDRIAQSFLFSGSRGVGKTSTARILAKALNCEKGKGENPCNKCTSCDEITRNTSLDVLEIDGASNRGIDEIRTLRENVKFKPAHGTYKIYIIDEVHMLTGEAFNALLKTLEEPPEHVKFIFATTEPHKVPLTILSRCQRFHFKRLSSTEIHTKLKEIIKKEKIKANEKTIYLIAKSADGSLRDAEGLLDQLASFSDGEIKEEDILFSLGLSSTESFSSAMKSIEARDNASILKLIHELTEQGKDLEQFLKGLLERFRDILVLQIAGGKNDWVEQDEETAEELKNYSKKFGKEELFLILALLQQALRDIKWSRTPRFLAETCLLKISSRADLRAVGELIADIKKGAPTIVSQVITNTPIQSRVVETKKEHTQTKPSPFKSESTVAIAEPPDPREKASVSESVFITLNDIERILPDLITEVKSKRMSIGTFLSESEPVEVAGNLVVFGFAKEFKFHKETIEQSNNKIFIRDILRKIVKQQVEVTFVITEPEKIEQRAVTNEPAPLPPMDSHVVMEALEIFEGSKVIRKT